MKVFNYCWSYNQSWENPRCEIFKAIADARAMSREFCLTCKGGRLLCGFNVCPLLQKIYIQSPIEDKLKENIFGPSPSVFVGWRNYPRVFAGPLTALDEKKADILDNPAEWQNLDFNDIIRYRSLLVRSKMRVDVHEKSRFILRAQEIALSVKPTDVELEFKSRPKYSLSFSPISQPVGPSDDLKVIESAFILYREGYDVLQR